MVIFPRAKINIGLRITERRPDGYHNIQTVFYPTGLCDALEYVVPDEKIDNDQLTETGLITGSLPENNLVILALKKIREHHPVPYLRIHLHKAIPSGAGLGGGSADAAVFIKSLNKFFDIGMDAEMLKEIASGLGSDCPFFIDNLPSYGEGRGEILTPVDPVAGRYFLVIVKPEDDISTTEAYRLCKPYDDGKSLISIYRKDISEWKSAMKNDFEEVVFQNKPGISFLKDELYRNGAVYSSMSGSGSAVYGIFNNKPELSPSIREKLVWSGSL
jgi:4-diphosphocytidyl-2-C-methyl-D-erythritol kinase